MKLIAARGTGEGKKVVTDVPAHVLGFSGVNFSLGIRLWEVTFVRHKVFGDFLQTMHNI